MTQSATNGATSWELVVQAISQTAPDAEIEAVDPAAPLRREIDIDSLDFLVLVEHIHRLTGVNIPEDDYRAVSSLNALVDYVDTRRLSRPSGELDDDFDLDGSVQRQRRNADG